MFRSGKFVAKHIHSAKHPVENHIQPNGVDVVIDDMRRLITTVFTEEDKDMFVSHPAVLVDPRTKEAYYMLEPGGYSISYAGIITVPKGHVGMMFPRSTLMRLGCMLHTALWDTGFSGVGMGLLTAHCYMKLGINVPVGQFCLIQAESKETYDGQYQGVTSHFASVDKKDVEDEKVDG